MADAPLLIVSPTTGETVRLDDPSQLAAAKAQGYTLASPDQAKAFMLEDKFGGTSGALKAFGQGALRSATFGGSDVVARALGTSAEELEGFKEANPTASGLGEAAGVVAPLLLPGVGEFTGVGQVAKAGAAVTEGVGRALGPAETTLGRIVKHAVASGTGLATEGAAYGLGHEVTEAALGDPEQTASTVFQHVGLSALMGGGLGGLFGAGAGALPSLVEKAGGSMEKLTDFLKDAYPDFVESMTGVPAEHTQALIEARAVNREEAIQALKGSLEENAPHGVRAPEDLEEASGLRPPKSFGPEAADTLQQLHEETVAAAKQAAREFRPAETAQLAVDIDSHAANLATSHIFDGLSNLATDLGSSPGINQTSAYAAVKRILGKIPEDWTELSSVEKYSLLNKLKQELRPYAKFGKFASDTEREAVKSIKQFYGRFADTLEDSSIWGDVGAAQSRYNTAKAAYDSAEDQFLRDWGRVRQGQRIVNPKKASSILSKLDDPNMQFERESLTDFLKTASDYHDAIQASAKTAQMPFDRASLDSLTNKSQELIANVRKSASQMEELAANNAKVGAQKMAFEQAEAGQMNSARELFTQLGGPKLGAVGAIADLAGTGGLVSLLHGHPIGQVAILGAKLLKKATSVTSVVGTLSKLEALNKATEGGIKRAADAILAGGQKAGAVGRGEFLHGVARNDDHETQRAIYDRLMDRVGHLSDPDTMMDHLDKATRDLRPHAPKTTEAVQNKVAAAVSHLKGLAPALEKTTALDRPRPATPKEIGKVLRAAHAIDNPHSLIEMARNGTLTKEHVDAALAVHPEAVMAQREAVMDAIARHPRSTVPLRARSGLSLLMGTPMDRARLPSSVQTTAAMYRAGPGQQGANPTASKAVKLTLAARSRLEPQRQDKA